MNLVDTFILIYQIYHYFKKQKKILLVYPKVHIFFLSSKQIKWVKRHAKMLIVLLCAVKPCAGLWENIHFITDQCYYWFGDRKVFQGDRKNHNRWCCLWWRKADMHWLWTWHFCLEQARGDLCKHSFRSIFRPGPSIHKQPEQIQHSCGLQWWRKKLCW